MQNIRKKLIIQFLEKPLTNGQTDKRTVTGKIIGPIW